MQFRICALLVLAAALTLTVRAPADSSPPGGDPAHGAVVYQLCMACHSLDEDDIGPHHRGVVGRSAGAVSGFGYSPALRDSHIVWSPANLDRWLANPQGLVPGARMFFAMPNAKDRADVIAYLSTQR
jgi:cytochrome c